MMHSIEQVIDNLIELKNTKMSVEQKESIGEQIEILQSIRPQNLQEVQKMEITERCFVELNLSDLEIIELIYLK